MQVLADLEERMGIRMVMTNRHDWETDEIIKAYYGQYTIEHAFRNIKNPTHLTLKPQFHWTDQKVIVYYFICILGFLLAALVWRQTN
jgi:transposase